jgi:hypothetical protein
MSVIHELLSILLSRIGNPCTAALAGYRLGYGILHY